MCRIEESQRRCSCWGAKSSATSLMQDAYLAWICSKAQSRTQIAHVGKQGLGVWPLIETVQGVEALAEIAGAKNVERLTYGALDFGVELGLKSGTTAANRMLDQVRSDC